ncbi:hypothetical protein TOPH_00524 [Tolypocladium ophioglossoides CBS 100239]|uniref:Uncharacterized protein n=1 Tax=Tolypocladium ophioglossoides (strain CBS 100239) TaxID=1163406 RepID=A0A0L0NM51_TOLOC|nr:hypothetical protein TOPH_00524 [Tolypocladium ophioglossoides CBS 100239]
MLQQQQQQSSSSLEGSSISGRSRFSQALPSVPALPNDASLLPMRKELPGLPRPPPPPPPPPPYSKDDDSKSIKCAIPRKPYLAQPSPTDSLSSLLSAYSREPDELPLGGSTSASAAGSSSSIGSSSSSSTMHAAERRTSPAGNRTTPAAPTTVNSSRRNSPPRHQKLPAPPPKDKRPLPSPRPASPSSKPQPAFPELATPSPPRPEIWRRRPHKSDNSRELPGLKLDHSHGSTASSTTTTTTTTTTAQPPPLLLVASPSSSSSRSLASQRSQGSTETIKAAPTPQPRSAAVGLPGRNVRPAVKQQLQQQVAETQAMGNGASKLNHFKDNLHRSRSPAKDAGATKNGHASSRPGAQRPPTPEYHKADVKTAPAVDTLVSPVSPASSSGSPKAIPADISSKALPPQPPKDAAEQPQSRPAPRTTLPPSAPNLYGAASLQDLNNKTGSVQSPASSRHASRRQSPANDSGSSHTRESAESVKFPPRSSSARPVERPRHSAPDGGDPRIVHSETQGPLYRGRDGTLYPEMKHTQEPDPRAAYFPLQAEKLLEPGTVIPARPLKDSHFSCYQNHRAMNRRTNRHYPLTCQTCDKADAEDRWVCTFCHLRICESCLRALNGHQRVLRRLVDELAMNTPLSLSSMSRPGSALGLPLVT